MHSPGEIRSFLQSAANYWLTGFHIDGLRIDAISRMIYWQGAPGRGVNMDAVKFLQHMNRGLKALHPTAILIAKDSTSYPDITKAAGENSLGFDYRWDMGWMNDTLDYCRTAPAYRSENYHKLTFSIMYYYHDRFLLPLSHDGVVGRGATLSNWSTMVTVFPAAHRYSAVSMPVFPVPLTTASGWSSDTVSAVTSVFSGISTPKRWNTLA